MNDVWLSVLAGILGGGLLARGRAHPLVGWIGLVPLGLCVTMLGPVAGIAGAITGALAGIAGVASRTTGSLLELTMIVGALGWGAASTLAGVAVQLLGPSSVLVLLPLVAVAGAWPFEQLGAPRFVATPIACTQERWLGVVHTARWGGARTTTATIALFAAAMSLGLAHPERWPAALAATLVVAIAIAIGMQSLREATRIAASAPRVRIAAVVVDAPHDGEVDGLVPLTSAAYRDVKETTERYAPHVREAAERGARLIVLPEVAVYVDDTTRKAWLDAVTVWARRHDVTIVAPYFDASAPKNTLAVVSAAGVVGHYDKQHPGRGLEPPAPSHTSPGPRPWTHALSTVICVDLDYDDLVAPVRAIGGVLCAPSNDWRGGFDVLHHDTSVWSAVCTGVATIRATGHGISSVRDGTGRVLAQASSEGGAVVLVVDAPLVAARTP